MAKLRIGWDVESDPEGTIWTAHEVGNSSHVLGRAISTYRGWRLEVVDHDSEDQDAGEVRGSWEDATAALADLLERAHQPGRYVVGQGIPGRAWHLTTERRPAGAGPHHPFWSRRQHVTACGRTIEGTAAADTFADGTPIPVCRRCERVARILAQEQARQKQHARDLAALDTGYGLWPVGGLVACAGCGGEYPATSLERGRCHPCARAEKVRAAAPQLLDALEDVGALLCHRDDLGRFEFAGLLLERDSPVLPLIDRVRAAITAAGGVAF